MKWFQKAVCAALAVLLLSAGTLCEAYMQQEYNVYLPNGLVGLSPTAVAGESYVFALMEEEQDQKEYTITATMGGAPVEVIDRGYGLYMIETVTGDIRVSMTRRFKSYSVTVVGSGAELVSCGGTATAGEIFRFYADPTKVEISVTIGGVPCRPGSGEGGKYTLLAPEVKGDIIITAKKIGQMFGVTFTGSGAADAAGNARAKEGETYRFTVNKAAGYTYKVTAAMGSASVAVTEEGTNGYVIGSVSGPLVITVEKVKQAAPKPEGTKPPAGSTVTDPKPAPQQPSGEIPAEPAPPAQTPEEPVLPETPAPDKPAPPPKFPDVNIGTVEEEEETEPFPWWTVIAGASAVLVVCGLLVLAGRKRVVFVTGCDAAVKTQRVFKGKLAARPAEPHKDGATFAGWFVDEADAKRWIFEENKVDNHVVLYAKWI